jgi:hypothetical protein
LEEFRYATILVPRGRKLEELDVLTSWFVAAHIRAAMSLTSVCLRRAGNKPGLTSTREKTSWTSKLASYMDRKKEKNGPKEIKQGNK